MHPAQREKNKQNSKDEAIIVVDEIEKANNKESKEKNSLIEEGIKDELKEETHVVQDIDQGNEDIEEDLED
jgi:hypothetical protein